MTKEQLQSLGDQWGQRVDKILPPDLPLDIRFFMILYITGRGAQPLLDGELVIIHRTEDGFEVLSRK